MRVEPLLEGCPGLAHGVTTRAGGVSAGAFAALNLGRSTGDLPEAVAENRRLAAAALGFPGLVTARQVHGARVACVSGPADEPGEADALVTDVPGVLLGVLGADCPGVLLVDPRRRALAVVHAGWRGAAAGVVAAAVGALHERFGSRPQDLSAAVGPGISQAAYEVGPEVVAALVATFPAAPAFVRTGHGDRRHLDLAGLLAAQLASLGVPRGRLVVSRRCTHGEGATYFSHRRDGPRAGRHALLAGWTL